MPTRRGNSKHNPKKRTKKQPTSVESSSSSLSVGEVHSPIEEPPGVGVVDEDWEFTPKHFDTSQASSLPEPEPEPRPRPRPRIILRRRQLSDPLNITYSGAGPPDSFYEETRGFAQRWRPLNTEDDSSLYRLLNGSNSSSSNSSSSNSSSSNSSSTRQSASTISPEEVEEKQQTRRQKRRRPRTRKQKTRTSNKPKKP
jgi:hypothetical protein